MRRRIGVLTLVLMLASTLMCAAVPTHDATSTTTAEGVTTSVSWNHTVSGGCANPMLEVKVGYFTTDASITSVTFNSVSVSFVNSEQSGSNTWGAVYRMV